MDDDRQDEDWPGPKAGDIVKGTMGSYLVTQEMVDDAGNGPAIVKDYIRRTINENMK